MRRFTIAALMLTAVVGATTPVSALPPNRCTAPATVKVNANITSSTLWTAANEYILTQPIYVTNGATLTIEPGTVIRGEPEASAGSNDPGALVITRDAKIMANGTKSAPIVFTDCFDDNVGASGGSDPYDDLATALGEVGNWGGVILLGRTYVSNNTAGGPNAAREVQIEGLTAVGGLGFYGNGGDDDDDSGVMSYVSIRYGGFNLSADNEINGLTFGAVGRQTDIDYVESIQTKDDCYEFFGGTVGVRHMICANQGDDGIDYDEGFRGKGQFIFEMQGLPGSDKSDKGGEHDGGNSPDASRPFAIPTFYNATYIGHGGNGGVGPDGSTVIDPAKAYTDKAKNTTLHFRDNAGGRYYNSFFADFGGSTMLIEGDPGTANTSGQRATSAYSAVYDGHCSVDVGTACYSDADCPAAQTCLGLQRGPVSDFQLELQDNVWWCYGAGNTIPDNQTAAVAAGGDGTDHYDNGAFSNGSLDNDYLACSTALPIRRLERTAIGGSTPDPTTAVDPRPVEDGPLTFTDRRPPADGFFTAAPFKGAFPPNDNWADGWSTLARLGYFDAPAPATVVVTNNITTSQTWHADTVYELDKPIYVTNGATLTIEPGTVIRSQPEASVGSNDPGALVITRDSKIDACGTADAPIVFTDLNDDNIGDNPGTAPYDDLATALGEVGNWGGVILLGRTYVSNNTAGGPNAAREVQIEGLTAVGGQGFYGNGGDDDDDSGRLCYANIRYGGFNLSADNEINGLTFGAVGRSTEIHHVETIQTKDDCYEFFGGTVGVKYMVCANQGDDGIDYDEGFRGKGQFIFEMQGLPGSDKSDKGGEHDGGNSPDASRPFAIPTFYNVTYFGHGGNGGVDTDGSTVIDPAKAYTDKARNTTLHMRDNAGGRYYNSFFANFGGSAILIEGDPGTANTSGQRARTAYSAVYDGQCSGSGAPCLSSDDCPGGETCDGFYLGEDSQYQLEIQNSCYWCFGGGSNVPDDQTAGVAAGGDGTDHFNNGLFKVCSNDNAPCNVDGDCPGGTCIVNAALGNDYFACSTALPVRTLVRTDTGPGIPDQVTSIDPRPNPAPGVGDADLLAAATRPTPDDGFFDPAPYKGAFSADNWADGWTTMSRLGYFPRCDGGAHPLAVPNEVRNLRWATIDGTTLAWDAPLGAQGDEFYDVLRSTDPSDFSSADCLETDDTDLFASDTEDPADGETFYYIVRPENACGSGPVHFSSAGVPVTSAGTCP